MVIIKGDRLVLVAAPGESLEFGPCDVDAAEEVHRVLSFWIARLRCPAEPEWPLPPQGR